MNKLQVNIPVIKTRNLPQIISQWRIRREKQWHHNLRKIYDFQMFFFFFPRTTLKETDPAERFSAFKQNVIVLVRYAYRRPVILRGLTDNTVGSSACPQVDSLIRGQSHLILTVIFTVPPEKQPNSLFILEIQILVLEGQFAHTVWRPDGGAQHGEHTLLQERCACGYSACCCVVSNSPPLSCPSPCHLSGVCGGSAQASGSGRPWQRWVEDTLQRHHYAPNGQKGNDNLPVSPAETLYFFGGNNVTEWASLFRHYEPPPYVLPHSSSAYSFGIAGHTPFLLSPLSPGFHIISSLLAHVPHVKISGDFASRPRHRGSLPLARSWVCWGHLWEKGEGPPGRLILQIHHSRSLAWLKGHLLFTQRWFFYPPEREPHFDRNRTTLSWVTEVYPNLPEEEAPLECTLRPGEVTTHISWNVDTQGFMMRTHPQHLRTDYGLKMVRFCRARFSLKSPLDGAKCDVNDWTVSREYQYCNL